MAVEGSHDAFVTEYDAVMKELTAVAQGLAPVANLLKEHAADLSKSAQMIAARRVDNDTVSETQQAAKTLAGIQSGANGVIARISDAVKVSQAALSQLKTTHDGTQEAMRRSPVDNRALADLDPTWITPQ
ncbi:hypothetical protein [Streptomyces sp. NPDC056982]|uniref:hypothetical protein n=1 Tax=Streptomyces sp. NPDC056982 TaxID=3345986 RepID=UPI003642D81E